MHDLLDRIYFEGEVLQRYRMPPCRKRCVAAVQANLHAFIELALNMDSGRYPSLARFIDEVAALRRAPEQESPDEGLIGDGGNALRILTIHGAKGLEAPIVWLLDANAAQRNESGYRILVDWPPEAVAPRHFSLVSRKAELARAREHYVEAEAAHARRENLNLLYVAMTRAKQALIVSGSASGKGGDSWYQKIQAGLQDAGLGAALSPAAAPFATDIGVKASASSELKKLPVPPTGRRDISRIDAARRHGIQLHALLEWVDMGRSLPEQKEVLQLRLGLEDSVFEPLWAEALELLRAPRLQRFFDPEQYLSAYNELGYQSGNGEMRRIDRLVEFADSVWVLDYKTGAGEVDDPDAIAAPYREQMREYRRAMENVFPGKPVRCALVFPGATLIEMD